MTPNSFGAVVVPRVWIENLFSDVDYRAWTIFTAMTIVAVGAFIWAAFVRKRRVDPHFHPMPPGREKSAMHGPAWSLIRLWKRKSNRRRRRSHWPGPPTAPTGKQTTWNWRRLLGRKRHHHAHRGRRANPTLAETGGLPPVRAEGSPPTAD